MFLSTIIENTIINVVNIAHLKGYNELELPFT